jgi:lysophospholipase L1-like esterase
VATEASAHPGVVYVDSWSLLADDGGYAAYLRTPSGTEQLVREPDGVHLSAAGSDRVAERVFQAMTALWSRAR